MAHATISTTSYASTVGVSSAASDEKKWRRRMQNRLSQRRHREFNRRQGAKSAQDTTKELPYTIERWRLEEYEPTFTQSNSNLKWYNSRSTSGGNRDVSVTVKGPRSQCLRKDYSLPADYLLHLTFQNAFRGFLSSKEILSQSAMVFTASTEKTTPEFHSLHSVFPSYSIVFPTVMDIPGGLDPTHEQMSRAHQTWIDLVPFPKMRNNLIQWESSFDHAEFVEDMVGHFVDMRPLSRSAASSGKQVVPLQDCDSGDADGSGKGLVLWDGRILQEAGKQPLGFYANGRGQQKAAKSLLRLIIVGGEQEASSQFSYSVEINFDKLELKIDCSFYIRTSSHCIGYSPIVFFLF